MGRRALWLPGPPVIGTGSRRRHTAPLHALQSTPACPRPLPPPPAASVLGLVGFTLSQGNMAGTAPPATAGSAAEPAAPAPPPRENAVLVFGATGRMGQMIVRSLVASGRTVVAAVRSTDKAATVMAGMGLQVRCLSASNASSQHWRAVPPPPPPWGRPHKPRHPPSAAPAPRITRGTCSSWQLPAAPDRAPPADCRRAFRRRALASCLWRRASTSPTPTR